MNLLILDFRKEIFIQARIRADKKYLYNNNEIELYLYNNIEVELYLYNNIKIELHLYFTDKIKYVSLSELKDAMRRK